MAEVTKDNFWDTDLKDLPWAIEINDNTPIVVSVWGISVCEYIQEWIGKWVDNILRNK